jgi:hypothetical protein
MDNNNNNEQEFREKNNNLIKSTELYTIALQKTCGYMEYMLIYKSMTLNELYKQANHHIPNINIDLLFVKNENGIVLVIPNDETNIRDFIMLNDAFFKPLYPLPLKVVYKILFNGCNPQNHFCRC